MIRAIFLDRDGVINEKRKDYVKNLQEIKMLPSVAKAIQKLNQFGYHIIIITNQSVINRKIISLEKLSQINNFIIKKLENEGAKISAIYYCPHIPDDHCSCRKPQAGLILKAINKHMIDPSQSIFIGDSKTDMEAAKKAGVLGLKIKTNGNLLDFINKQIIQS